MLSRLSLNSLWLLLARVGGQLGLAVSTVILARGLGSVAFGEYAFIVSVVFVGNILTTFGTDMLLIREIAATEDLSDLRPALLIQLVLSGAFIGVAVLGTLLLPARDPAVPVSLRVYSLSLVPLAFFTVYTTALRGRQQMLAYGMLNVAIALLQVLVSLWVLWQHGNLIELAVLLLLVQVVAALLAGLTCAAVLREPLPFWLPSPRRLTPLLRASAPIALLGLLGVIYQRLSLLALPALAGAAATGWFSASARVVEAAKIGHVAVLTALYPMMAEARGAGVGAWSKAFRVPWLILLVGAVLASAALYLLAPPLIHLLFGSEYAASISILRILTWMLVPYTLNSFLTLAFLARSEEGAVVKALILSTVVLLILTIWWTPQAGAVGAARAALCAEIAQALFFLSVDLRRVRVLNAILKEVNEP